MHRDPLGLLREAQQRFGELFTVRLATAAGTLVIRTAARGWLSAVRRLRPILREPESMVLRGTILVPRRSVPLRATMS